MKAQVSGVANVPLVFKKNVCLYFPILMHDAIALLLISTRFQDWSRYSVYVKLGLQGECRSEFRLSSPKLTSQMSHEVTRSKTLNQRPVDWDCTVQYIQNILK